MNFIMNFIRKYIALIIPGVITLVAVIFFLMTPLVGGSVKKEMEKSVRQAKRIQSMIRSVPSEQQADQEKIKQDKLEQDAVKIMDLVQQGSLRELISYKVFPKPKDSSVQIFQEFGIHYREKIESLVKKMNALDAPSKLDIDRALHGAATDSRGYRSRSQKDSSDTAVDAICLERADSISVYAHPDLYPWYSFWDDYDYVGVTTAVQDCWYSQVAYWIYEDVTQTITEMNKGSEKVFNSPVKRLLGISFTKPVIAVAGTRGQSGKVSDERFEYVTEDDLVSVMGVEPWTNRTSDKSIDVIHFSLAVVVDARDVMNFLKVLNSEKESQYREGFSESGQLKTTRHNQITVLKYRQDTIDLMDQAHEYYRYGDDAVVRVDLICEYIFGKKGYEKIKPESIAKMGADDEDSRLRR